jgi:hypothetical protein
MRCSACTGVYHEATGHRLGDRTVLCGPCARSWLAWLKSQTNRRWGGVRFYDHTETSRNKT